jgi:hypothetical protein
MFTVPPTHATFDPSQMYSAKTEKEAAQAAKKAAKEAAKIVNAGCGNFSCRICYNVVQRVASAISREIKIETKSNNRIAQENLVDEFMRDRRSSRIDECVERIIKCAHGEISI